MIRDEQQAPAAIDQVHRDVKDSGLTSIAVTGVARDVGATTVAVELAERLAHAGVSTLLVEMDVLNPRFPQRFNIAPAEWWPGDPGQMSEIRAVSSSLHVLAAPDIGGAHVTFRERSGLMAAVGEWKGAYQTVILDCPPINDPDPDQLRGEVLASVTDGAILVVKAGQTTEADLLNAVKALDQRNAPVVGIILNDADNPPLRDELTRQIDKLGRFSPPVARWLRSLVERSTLLNTKP